MADQQEMSEKSIAAATTTTAVPINQGPEWEVPSDYQPKSVLPPPNGVQTTSSSGIVRSKIVTVFAGLRSSSRQQLDRFFPPNKTYTPLKWKRRTFLLVLLGFFVALLALIIGLAAGLTLRKKHGSQNLPLPTGSTVYYGDLTYYEPGLGACGMTSTADEDIVAVSHALWDSQATGSNPNANPLCGRMIRVRNFDQRVGKDVSLDVKVVDRCVGCQPTDLDLSPGAFNKLADPNLGRVHNVAWAWI